MRPADECGARKTGNVYVFPEGFGQVLLGAIRQARQSSMYRPVEFPLTLGRDFCGEIVAKGVKVKSDLKIGDTVMGVVPPFQQGCHAEFVSVSEGLVRNKMFIDRCSARKDSRVVYDLHNARFIDRFPISIETE